MKKILIMLAMALLLTGCQAKEVSQEIQEVKEEPKTKQTLDVNVIGATEHTEDKWDELEDGKKLILLEVSITNNSNDDYEFNPNYLLLNINSQKESISDKIPKDTEVLNSGYIKPGETLKGYVSFEVMENITDYEVYYEDYGDNSFKVK